MKLRSYIVEHDLGFAPNPFHGTCTLATCKPRIRSASIAGDYVLGTGSKKRNLQGHIVYLMRVGRITTFDEYWSDPEFAVKRPVLNGSRAQQYGDNIYHRDPKTGAWIQEDSFHSREGGVPDPDNLETDTGYTDRVLIADWCLYWGGEGPRIPEEFSFAIQKTQGHKIVKDEARIQAIVNWAKSVSAEPILGEPTEWSYLKERRRKPLSC